MVFHVVLIDPHEIVGVYRYVVDDLLNELLELLHSLNIAIESVKPLVKFSFQQSPNCLDDIKRTRISRLILNLKKLLHGFNRVFGVMRPVVIENQAISFYFGRNGKLIGHLFNELYELFVIGGSAKVKDGPWQARPNRTIKSPTFQFLGILKSDYTIFC